MRDNETVRAHREQAASHRLGNGKEGGGKHLFGSRDSSALEQNAKKKTEVERQTKKKRGEKQKKQTERESERQTRSHAREKKNVQIKQK